MNALDKILKQYETSKQKADYSEKKYDLKNYFSTFIEKNVKEGSKTIRILPASSDGETPFVTMYAHKYKLESGDWKTYPCLKKEEGKDCPFCEVRTALLAEGSITSKELAKTYNVRKFYVVKVIDRDNESDGVKFWRFNDNWQNTGTYDKIIGIYKAVKDDIADPKTGRDLIINITKNATNSPTIQSIVQLDKSPLSTNEATAAEWMSDKRTWRDVYSIKDYAYLEIVAKGGSPTWDKEKGCWVDNVDNSHTKPATVTENELDTELTVSGIVNQMSSNDNDDDIPF